MDAMTEPVRDKPKRTWPVDQRPYVWVTTETGRHPGREHGYRNHGRLRLVEWTVAGLTFMAEHPALYVEHRPPTDTEPD